MTVPVDFHITLHEDVERDDLILNQVALMCAQLFVDDYVNNSNETHGIAIIHSDADED